MAKHECRNRYHGEGAGDAADLRKAAFEAGLLEFRARLKETEPIIAESNRRFDVAYNKAKDMLNNPWRRTFEAAIMRGILRRHVHYETMNITTTKDGLAIYRDDLSRPIVTEYIRAHDVYCD